VIRNHKLSIAADKPLSAVVGCQESTHELHIKIPDPLTHCPIEEVEQAFAKIAQYFGDVLAKRVRGHP